MRPTLRGPRSLWPGRGRSFPERIRAGGSRARDRRVASGCLPSCLRLEGLHRRAVLILPEASSLDYPVPVYDVILEKVIPTLRDLLGHTSGIHDYLDRPDNMRWVRGEYTVKELIDSFKDRDPDFAPGERMAYSNSNYILLGAILEKVTGLPLSAAVQDLVLRPLGLGRTFYDEELTPIPGRAAGYEPFRTEDGAPDWTRSGMPGITRCPACTPRAAICRPSTISTGSIGVWPTESSLAGTCSPGLWSPSESPGEKRPAAPWAVGRSTASTGEPSI